MKVYVYSVRRKPGTEQLVTYRRGPFASYEEWHKFTKTRAGRKMGMDYAVIDEEPDPPLLHYNRYLPLNQLALPYPLLIRSGDGALITSKGEIIFDEGPRPE